MKTNQNRIPNGQAFILHIWDSQDCKINPNDDNWSPGFILINYLTHKIGEAMKIQATIKYQEGNGRRFLVSNGLATGYIERRKYGSSWLHNGFLLDRRINIDRRQKEMKQ